MDPFLYKPQCSDPKERHKKLVYQSSKAMFRELGQFVEILKRIYPDKSLSEKDLVCPGCYKILEDEVNNASLSSSQATTLPSSEEFDDEKEIAVANLNMTSINLNLKVSPIKLPQSVNVKMQKTYAVRKRKQLTDAFDNQISRKITKLYDITDLPDLSEATDCEICLEWIKILSNALENCKSFQEKVRLLTVVPSNFSKAYLLSVLPGVTTYMLDQARSLVKDGVFYKEIEKYSGHSVDKEVISTVMEYYLNDDFNCSRQSANKNDTISIRENGVKVKRVKRFLTRSIKEICKIIYDDNPSIKSKIGKSKIYSLRPKWVILHPPSDTCLCVYCENWNLMLIALKNYLKDRQCNSLDIESIIFSSLYCSKDDMKCVLSECKNCPKEDSIQLGTIFLTEEDLYEEINYSIWEKTDLLNKTVTIADFLVELRKNTVAVSAHKMLKEIQRIAIKDIKIAAKSSQSKLVVHVDFAQNWTVLLQNEIQSCYWSKKQISIFTAVCYCGNDITVSYVVLSDDIKHDSAHATKALNLVIQNMKEKHIHQEIDEIIIISDGAGSQFKNRYQFYELRKCEGIRIWIFSATGHGKGAVDGIGGLVKHYATTHNLSSNSSNSIRNAEEFAAHMPKYTTSINVLVIPKTELEDFREMKKVEWQENAKEIKGIQKLHYWKNEKNSIYTAQTSRHDLKKLR